MWAENLPFIAGAGVLFLVIWLFLQSKKKPPKSLVIPQFLFTVTGKVHRLEAEAVAGFMTTEYHGGQFEDPDAVVIHRRGRLWAKPRDGRDPNVMRRRSTAYVTRQGDSSVLNLRHLFDEKVPLRSNHKRADLRPRRNLATRQAMQAGIKSGSNRDLLTRRMMVIGLISVLTGGIAWLTVTIIAAINAAPQS